MLSATDVHYLVGFLTLISTPEDVEIMLGDLVYDASIDKDRDVDVTITYRDPEGKISAFKGIEVKKHSRPLDVIHVEQLAIKLNDMPNISNRAIVSASGYTQPAIKKAKVHGINLFSLIPWDNPMQGFGHVSIPENFFIQEMTLTWVGNSHVKFNPNEDIPNEIKKQITGGSPIFNSSGKQDNLYKTIKDLSDKIKLIVIDTIKDREYIKSIPVGIEKNVNIKSLLKDLGNFYLCIGNLRIHLQEVLVQGKVKWVEKTIHPEFKVLVKEGESKPFVGCAIAEHSTGNLIGLTVSQFDRTLRFVNIPISDRNQKKIHLHKLR